jgi:hypothetical protein
MDIPKMNPIRLVVKNPRVPVKGLGGTHRGETVSVRTAVAGRQTEAGNSWYQNKKL